jgi:hypothetical protein
LEPLGLGARLWLAFILPWKILFDGTLAARVEAAETGELPKLPPAEPEPRKAKEELREVKAVAAEPDATPALQLLAILQREGRFVDFLKEDVSAFPDADIGAAARVVHEGCARALKDIVDLLPVRDEEEGAPIELPAGYDAAKNRVTGNVKGEPPFRGKLAHHGWRVAKVRMPKLTAQHDATIVAPAEIEL